MSVTLDPESASRVCRRRHLPESVEWPTILVAAMIWVGLAASILTHPLMPWWVTVPLLMFLAGWYASLQHEVVHGHPTPWVLVNTAIAGVPLDFLYSLARFRDLHLAHHDDPSRLTEPGIDPESRYCSSQAWEQASRCGRLVLQAERTLVGWLTIGVVRGSIRYVISDLRAAGRDRRIAGIWARHVIGCAVLGYVIVGVAGLPLIQMLAGLVYGRMFCTGLRTFAEHRWVNEGTMSAVVHAGPPLALLFLNNNLHHTHHVRPDAAWYRLPKLNRDLGSDAIASAGAGLYVGGYAEQWRRFGVRPFCQPVHPSSRRIS